MDNEWVAVEDQLPELPGMYLIYIQEPLGWVRKWAEREPWERFDGSYVAYAQYDDQQKLWVDGSESYNAALYVVDKEEAYHVTHWMKGPGKPSGTAAERILKEVGGLK